MSEGTTRTASGSGRDRVGAALARAVELGATTPLPGGGATLERWRVLAALAAEDLTTARVVEAHLDALAVLAEHAADHPGELPAAGPAEGTWGVGATWGVFAAEAPDARLLATPGPDGTWTLTGRKPWCSLAGRLSHALVTATTPTGRRLFALDLRSPGVRPLAPGEGGWPGWHARGLTEVVSGPVDLEGAPALPLGDDGWYLRRPGFAHGGIGVAACWYGGALALARGLRDAAARRAPDQLARWHVGAADLELHAARTALETAAAEVDAGRARGSAGEVLALRTRSRVAAAAEAVLARVGHALGPGPLTGDAATAERVADLTVYVRQHHAERDLAALGGLLLAQPGTVDGWTR